ncbi:hypothetical protein SAMN05216587_104160 [Selenomonas ruminantium]|uniref:Uncharacterized protein n=1 Tax=Selenomonas ruminantium TaxID=971 RepID=A0A1I0X3L5_SELRU|nr:hypothetical protein SAMN05216587_104160 [Selenomonas ruminantium]
MYVMYAISPVADDAFRRVRQACISRGKYYQPPGVLEQ